MHGIPVLFHSFHTTVSIETRKLSTETNSDVETSESQTHQNITALNFFCPHLEKLHLIFRKEMPLKDLLLFVSKMVECSGSKLDEVTLFIPYSLYANPKKFHELTYSLPEVLPHLTFCFSRYEDDVIRRKGTSVSEEKKLALRKALDDMTRTTAQSLGSDLLKGLEEKFQRDVLADIEIKLEKGEVAKAHRVILENRCPKLLELSQAPIKYSAAAFDILLKYLYSDTVPIDFPTTKASPKSEVLDTFATELLLRELKIIAKELEIIRLESLSAVLLDSLSHIFNTTEIPAATLETDLLASITIAKSRSHIDSFNPNYEVLLAAPSSSDQVIKVSRFILSSRCMYFDKLFSSGMRESSYEMLNFDDVTFDALKNLVYFLYSNTSHFEMHSIIGTYVLADRMGLPVLQSQCVNNVKNNLSVTNIVYLSTQVYRSVVDSTQLAELCFNFFISNAVKVFDRIEDILSLDWEMLRVFLSYVYNHLLEETNDEANTVALQVAVLRAVLHWAKAKSLKTNSTQVDLPKLRSTLQGIFRYIHTNRVSPVDFGNCIIHSQIFPKPFVIQAFAGMGVVLDDEEESRRKKVMARQALLNSSDKVTRETNCATCSDWGYIRVPAICSKCKGLAATLGFCSWCNSTGTSMQIGPPCKECIRGELVSLKSMFDQKVLDECIRIHIPAHERLKSEMDLEVL